MIQSAALNLIETSTGLMLAIWSRRYVCYTLPGGIVEAGETPEGAAARELREETGLLTESSIALYDAPLIDDKRASHVYVYRPHIKRPPHWKLSGDCRRMTRSDFLKQTMFYDWTRLLFHAVGLPNERDATQF